MGSFSAIENNPNENNENTNLGSTEKDEISIRSVNNEPKSPELKSEKRGSQMKNTKEKDGDVENIQHEDPTLKQLQMSIMSEFTDNDEREEKEEKLVVWKRPTCKANVVGEDSDTDGTEADEDADDASDGSDGSDVEAGENPQPMDGQMDKQM